LGTIHQFPQVKDSEMELAHALIEQFHTNLITLNEEDWEFFEDVINGTEKDELDVKRRQKKFQRLMDKQPAWEIPT